VYGNEGIQNVCVRERKREREREREREWVRMEKREVETFRRLQK
jgi:hypothetical protein